MLDGRILAAVFASLAAIGAGMNGGHVDAGELRSISDTPKIFDGGEFNPETFGPLKKLLRKPEPQNDVRAVIEVDELDNQELSVRSGSLYIANLTSIKTGNREIISDESLMLYGYSGKLMPDTSSQLKGRAKGILTSNVNISGRFNVEKDFESSHIRFKNVERSGISLEDVSGTVESNSTTTNVRGADADLNINSFSGNMSVYPGNSTVVLSGKVDKLSAGDVSFGS